MPGRQLVDLIIARNCRRPRKCQAGRQAKKAVNSPGGDMEARHARRPGSRQEMPGRQLVDLIIARKCRRPRKCQAGRQAGRQAMHARRLGSRQAGQEAGQPLQASQARRPGGRQARQQASPGQAG